MTAVARREDVDGSNDFKVGDRFDTGVALAYRLTESIKTFPQYSVFAELNDVQLMRDEDGGVEDPNSGSNTLYLTPGGRIRFNKNWALTVAPSLPIPTLTPAANICLSGAIPSQLYALLTGLLMQLAPERAM